GFILKNYATALFSSAIRENLRQNREIDICTDWGLLRKITKKFLVESLQNAGLLLKDINDCILAWNCFKSIYIPTQKGTSRQISQPDNEIWEAIVKA
ncbi:MAG: sigma-70 family RNA polymerase sigma factor, partial [Nostoc sp.]